MSFLKLPGVGRKSANLIMGDVFGKPAIVTDTHCIRLVNRMGLVDGIKEPKKVEMALWKLCLPRRAAISAIASSITARDVRTARTKPYCDSVLRERSLREKRSAGIAQNRKLEEQNQAAER